MGACVPGPVRTVRAALGGVVGARLATPTPPSAARALLYGSLCMAAESWGVMLAALRRCARAVARRPADAREQSR
jgi:hypothetical protein